MMRTPEVSIIAAVSDNRAIGRDNKLLWRIPADLKHFRQLTTGHPVIMGRKTFESIGQALPDRTNIVMTKDESFRAEGCVVCHSLIEALEIAKSNEAEKIFVIGGETVYQEAIDLVDKLYLTIVNGEFEADAFFPDYSEFKRVVFEQPGESNDIKFRFLELER